jgi:hypothetical protein
MMEMPFVSPEHRESPDMTVAGDRCYVEARRIWAMWYKNPRWTTVDEIASFIYPNPIKRAFFLAFLVFFAMRVMPYEIEKLRENGDIQ